MKYVLISSPPIKSKYHRRFVNFNRQICQAEFDGSNFRLRPSHFQGAGRLVQQGEGEGHHVGRGEVHFSQCTWFNPNFSS